MRFCLWAKSFELGGCSNYSSVIAKSSSIASQSEKLPICTWSTSLPNNYGSALSGNYNKGGRIAVGAKFNGHLAKWRAKFAMRSTLEIRS